MKLLLLMSLLIYSSIQTAQTGIFSQSETEGSNITLGCGNEGKVVWTKGTDRGTSTILTAEDGEITQRLRPDPENRYSVLTDLSLVIRSVSLSDSGIYYCNSAPAVNLTVNPAPPAGKGGDKPEENQPDRKGLWIALIGVGGVVLLALASLSIKTYFSERTEDCEMPYDDIYTTIEYATSSKA
ncbi:hypothetical protein SRHO_G00099590 [Serrasalmus rhombeus]